jgi:hypothetical protein
MIKTLLLSLILSVIFSLIGLIALAPIASLFLGRAAFPVTALVLGATGFVYGWSRKKKQ